MDEQEQHILILLEKYEQGLASQQEVEELNAWYHTFEDQPDIMAGLTDMEKLETDMRNIYQTISAKAVNLRLQINTLLEGYESKAK